MFSKNSKGSRAAWTRGFMAPFAITLAMGLGLMASPVEAAPFAYVTNGGNTVSVIDTATNPPSVVATIPVAGGASDVAVTPDGKHVYVTGGVVSVIDTATNTVVATIPVGTFPQDIAVTPDGKHAYVTNPGPTEFQNGTVSVIDTATNTVEPMVITVGSSLSGVAVTPDGKHVYVTNFFVSPSGAPFFTGTVLVIDTATNTVEPKVINVGINPNGIAVAPDGKHAYVTNLSNNNFMPAVSVIDTATKTVVATVPVGGSFGESLGRVAVTPDGKHVYATNFFSNNVSVIDTASNTVVATVPVGSAPLAVAVTPDGKHAYVANLRSDNVSVIDTATNTVVATVPVPAGASAIAIVPPPRGVPFLAFNARLEIDLDRKPNKDRFELESSFTLSSTASNGIHPDVEPVTLQVGTFTTTIPPGSFKKHKDKGRGRP